MESDYAVIVGINHYPGLKRPLQGAIADARAFRDWAQSATGGAVPPKNVKLIESTLTADDPPDALPGQKEITRAFARLLEAPVDPEGRVGRRLYIFFAGHGFAARVDEACVITADARMPALEHAAAHGYARHVRESGRFDQICLFLDCCRELFDRVPISEPTLVFDKRPRACDVVSGFAADWSRLTEERPIDGTVRGVFSAALLNALSVGRVTAEQLKAYTFEAVRSLVGNDASLKFPIDTNGPFVFNESAPPPNVAVTLRIAPGAAPQAVRIEDGKDTVLWSGQANGQPVSLSLEPGKYVAMVGAKLRYFDVLPTSKQDIVL